MKAVLLDWEEKTEDINTLYCPITRYEFDSVFGKETRWVGKVYFENKAEYLIRGVGLSNDGRGRGLLDRSSSSFQ